MNEPDVVAPTDADFEPLVEAPIAEQPPASPADSPTDPTGPDAEVTHADVTDNVVTSDASAIDLDAIERDLTDVQTALDRLNEGTYWTDQVTGQPIPDDVLASHPTARTASPTL